MVSIIDEKMVGGPHLPLYVLHELIGIQRGKEEKNISFWQAGRLETYQNTILWYLKRPKYLIKYDLLNLITLRKRFKRKNL